MSPFGGDGAFTVLFERAGVGIGQLGTDGRWLRANHRLLEILGYSAERIERLGYLDLVHPADLEEAQQLLRQVADGEARSLRREQRFCRSVGTDVWVRLTLSAAAPAGERPAFLIGVVEDISERRRALDALREQEIRLTEAQRIARVGSWTHDLRGGRITLSLEAARILGLDPQRADFEIAEVLARVFVEDREAVREALERQVTAGGETVLQARIGSGAHEICVECRSRIELGGSGRPRAVVGTIQDVTQHRRAEERLRHQEAYLRAVIDANPNPVFAKDRDGRFTVANAAVAEL